MQRLRHGTVTKCRIVVAAAALLRDRCGSSSGVRPRNRTETRLELPVAPARLGLGAPAVHRLPTQTGGARRDPPRHAAAGRHAR
jgi:hypothetical protein